MSGFEVVAAVAAVVSAFHAGAELHKRVKERRSRRARDSAQQKWENDQLQASLVAGEQQIDLRYQQDQKELGEIVRIGDGIARQRLQQITLMLQAEIIKSLKDAATHEVCVLDLRFLYEASIMNRKETLVVLDELKQRIYIRRPITRNVWHPNTTAPAMPTDTHRPVRSLSDAWATSVANLPPQNDLWDTRHNSIGYYPTGGSRDTSSTNSMAYEPYGTRPDVSRALEGLHPEHREDIMNNLQRMIDQYQGLGLDSGRNSRQGLGYSEGYIAPHDSFSPSTDRNAPDRMSLGPDKDLQYNFSQSPRAESGKDTTRFFRPPAFGQDLSGSQAKQFASQPYVASNPYPYLQTQVQTAEPRRSQGSATSSSQSNLPSVNRNSSNSSQGSNHHRPHPSSQQSLPSDHGRVPPLSTASSSTYQPSDESCPNLTNPSSPYAVPEERYAASPIAPLAPARNQPNASPNVSLRKDSAISSTPATHSSASPPSFQSWLGAYPHREPLSPTQCQPPQRYVPIEEEAVDVRMPQQYPVAVSTGQVPTSMYGHRNEYPMTPPGVSAFAASTSIGSPNPVAQPRHYSIAPSIASSDSGGSMRIGIIPSSRARNPFRTDTIENGPVGGERMMDGRPDKGNDYWGFCKGAWAVREDQKKGLSVRTHPTGRYSTSQVWGCKSCTFTGDVCKAPHPTKKNKSIDIIDPRIKLSKSGIRYRWIFLAKSHVKKRAADPSANDDNFGCVFCCLQDKVTGVYGGVETLLNHISHVHAADMSEQVARKAHCVVGRVAAKEEEFDINVPIFGQVEELPA
ncbi:hypothetical protein DDE82_004038 [Stemphylium lycopersici]|nr:hypothetical protein DDE82_004038 [Stemphylium lycopersici]